MNADNYIVATIHDRNILQFHLNLKKLPGVWHLITSPEELTFQKVVKINPKIIFFPHWSWIVENEIINQFECICFHATDLPFGRGGSPIQNLIVRGYKNTMISAIRMVKELDAGPIYLKKPLSLIGRAEDIYNKATIEVSNMISEILEKKPIPESQKGETIHFMRRKNNLMPMSGSMENIYNHIRMLDADGYPNLYLEHGEFILNFSQAEIVDDKVIAKVIINRKDKI